MSFQTLCQQKNLIKGDVNPFKVNGREIIVIWHDDGELKAFQGECPHQKVPLAEGRFSGRTLTCGAHMWVFDARSGKGLQPKNCALLEYPVRLDNGEVQIDLDPNLSPPASVAAASA
jgi:toluene monooxygenase system ferredoxin subunit